MEGRRRRRAGFPHPLFLIDGFLAWLQDALGIKGRRPVPDDTPGPGVWRFVLTEEYSKYTAKGRRLSGISTTVSRT